MLVHIRNLLGISRSYFIVMLFKHACLRFHSAEVQNMFSWIRLPPIAVTSISPENHRVSLVIFFTCANSWHCGVLIHGILWSKENKLQVSSTFLAIE